VQISGNSSNDIAYWHLTGILSDFKYKLSELSGKKSEKYLIKLCRLMNLHLFGNKRVKSD
jgi:hypothetical protein